MKKTTYISILMILFSFFSKEGSSQGRVDGFFKQQGNLDVALGVSYEANPNYFAGTEKIHLTRNITSYNSYVAYGITNRLDVNLSLPYINVNGAEKDFQDWSVFLKYELGNFSIGNTKVKAGLAAGYSSNITDYQTEGGNAIGQQPQMIDVRPLFHFSFNKGFFATIQGGYSYKFDPVPSSIPFAMKFGVAKSKFYADIWYDFQHGIGGLDYRGTPAPASFRELGVSYHKIGGTIYKPFGKNFGAFVGLAYVLSGRNVSQGIGGNIGIVIKHYNNKNK